MHDDADLIRHLGQNPRRASSPREPAHWLKASEFAGSPVSLTNRAQLIDHIQAAIARHRGKHRGFVLLLLSLQEADSSPEISDRTGGKPVGQTLTEHLRAGLRARDKVVWLGDAEYCVILDQIDDQTKARGAMERIRSLASQPIRHQTGDIRLLARIGQAVYPKDGIDPSEILSQAEEALGQAGEEALIKSSPVGRDARPAVIEYPAPRTGAPDSNRGLNHIQRVTGSPGHKRSDPLSA
ncbi:diguanylate cyclase domain-containing protein [Thiocystis violacea]|uniref:diguanylate cyclase domain-containing protein n=1 Tax=Thiocystis violacea TaxID=13725 RepID=UPI0019065599|nr:diguanylate cyclase [Thiocystis violacea]MBK1719275.1 hypothetical protein [Thiocystis violacea]